MTTAELRQTSLKDSKREHTPTRHLLRAWLLRALLLTGNQLKDEEKKSERHCSVLRVSGPGRAGTAENFYKLPYP